MATSLEDKISVRCGGCDTEIKVKPQFAGRKMPCPLCEEEMQIPAASGNGQPKKQAAEPPREAPRTVCICSGCGMQMAVKSKYAGKFVPCPQCQDPVRVPCDGEDPVAIARRYAVRRDRIKCQCISCSLLLVVKEEFAGRLVPCPRCRETVTIPGERQPQPKSNDSGSFLMGGVGAAEDDNPFDLDAMLELADEVESQSHLNELWSAEQGRGSTARTLLFQPPAATRSGVSEPSQAREAVAEAETPAIPPTSQSGSFIFSDAQDASTATGSACEIPHVEPRRQRVVAPTGQAAAAPQAPTSPASPSPSSSSSHLTDSSVFEIPKVAPPASARPLTGSSAFQLPQMSPPQPGPPLTGSSALAIPQTPYPAAPTTPAGPLSDNSAFEIPQNPTAESEANPESRNPGVKLPPPKTEADHSDAATAEPDSFSSSTEGLKANLIRIECGKCQRQVKASHTLAGQTVKCPKRAAPVRIPSQETDADASRDQTSINLEPLVAAACKASQPSIPADRMLEPVLRTSRVKKLASTLSRAQSQDAPRNAIEAANDAIAELCEARDSRAVQVITEALPQLPIGLQTQALKHLGELGDPTAFSAAAPFLTSTDEPLMRAAVMCLGGLGDRRAVQPLLALSVAGPQHRVRTLDAIVKIGDHALPVLLETLDDSDDISIRHAALEVLGRLKNNKAIPAMARFLEDESVVMRRAAAEMLGQIGGGKAAGALLGSLADVDEIVRLHTVQGLTRTPDPRFAPRLAKLLQDESRDVSLAALEALGSCGDKRTVNLLRPFLEHEDDEFVMAAAEALGRLGDAGSVDLLAERLEAIGDNPEQRPTTIRIVDALRRIGDSRAALPLVDRLQHPSSRVRARVAEALGKMGDAGVRPALEDLLSHDAQDEVRAAAAKALGELGQKEAIPTLVNIGLSEGPTVRVQTLIALGRLNDKSILSSLDAVASDNVPQVRYQLAAILGDLGDRDAIPMLEPLAFDGEEIVRRAARRSLQELGDSRSEKELRKAAGKRVPKAGLSTASMSIVEPRKPKRKRSFTLLDLVPSSVAGLMSLPTNLISSVRHFDADRLAAVPGGKMTITAAGLLIAGGAYFWIQSLGGPVTYSSAPPRGAVASLDASADGKFLAAGRTRNMVEFWDVEHQRVTDRVLKAPSRWVACDPEGTHVVAADPARVMHIKVTDGGEVESTQDLAGHKNTIVNLAASDDGRYAATLDVDGEVVRWEIASGKGTSLSVGKPPQGKRFDAIALSPDGSQLASVVTEGPLAVWDFSSGGQASEFRLPKQAKVTALAFSPDGGQVVAAVRADGNKLLAWKTDAPGDRPTIVDEGFGGADKLMFRSDGKLIASSGATADVWDLATSMSTPVKSNLSMDAVVPLANDLIAVGDDEEPPILIYDNTGKLAFELNDSPTG